GAMGTGAQNCAAPGIPAKEEHVILRVAVMPERFVRGIEPEQFANAFVRFYLPVTGRAFRPANRPGGSCDRAAFVRSIPSFHSDLDCDEPKEKKKEEGRKEK